MFFEGPRSFTAMFLESPCSQQQKFEKMAKDVGISPAVSMCSTVLPPSPLKLDSSDEGSSSSSDSEKEPSPSTRLPPSRLQAFSAVSLKVAREDSDDNESLPDSLDSALVDAAELELRHTGAEAERRDPAKEEASPTYFEEWFEFFRGNRGVEVDDEHLLGMEEADEAEEEEEEEAAEEPFGCEDKENLLLLSKKSQELLYDEDGDLAHEFWVENLTSGALECRKRSRSERWQPLARMLKRLRQ
mmetsp:Transcript_51023/g.91887  ORF Transcript_51023/g.91887 Transcript_51023/m.91887 type:complete len:244 (-) Transcript_51023:22-753(-)